MKRKLIYLIAAASLSIILSALSVTAQDYEIRLERPSKAGDKYSLSAIGSQRLRLKLTSGKQIVREMDDAFTLELTAEATVLTVDAGSSATSKSFTITSSKLTKNGATKPLLPNGSIVLATLQDRHTLFQLNGKPVADDVAKALSVVIGLHASDSISDEAMFGTSGRKRVGESWNLNVDIIMAFIKELGGQARKEDIKGTAVFKETQDNHLIIHSLMAVVNVSLPLPAGYKAENGTILSELTSKLPLPNSDGSIENSNKLSINLSGRLDATPDKPEGKINMTYENSVTFKTIPTKQPAHK